MKSALICFLLFAGSVTGNKSYGQIHAINSGICVWDADFSESDIKHSPSKLESRVSPTFQFDATNKGTCVWRKSEVYVKVTVKKSPKTVSSSEANSIFKTSQKFYLNNDYVTKGGSGRFIMKFNSVVDPGPYELEFVIMNKEGKRISDAIAVIYQFAD
jgi:hypothetical protein